MEVGLKLTGEPIREAGPREPLCVDPTRPLREVLALLKDQNRGEVLICRKGRLVGIFTERDALGHLASADAMVCPIERLMTANPVALRADDTLDVAVMKMAALGHRRLPIVDTDGRPTGLVTAAGIVRWLVEHFPEAVYNLPPVSKPATEEREGP